MSRVAAVEAVKRLRTDLGRNFGGVLFQVTAVTAYDTSTIEVVWTDGPPLYAADAVVSQTMRRFEKEAGPERLSNCLISKRRTMSPRTEAKILSLLADALGTQELDAEQVHPTPPLLTRQEDRVEMGTVPEFLDLLFEQLSFCRECPAPASGGKVPCPCIKLRSQR
jgi:hypothetical protein